MNAGGRLFGHAAHLRRHLGPVAGVGLVAEDDAIHENAGFLGIARLVEHGRIAVRIHAEMDHQGSVPPVVHDEIRAGTVRPRQGHFRAPPIILKRFALPREHLGVAEFRDGGRGVILRGEDVAGRPADIRAELVQRLNEHGGLDGHVQRAHDFEALEGLLVAVAADEFHQAGHFALGKLHFLLAEVGKADIRHLIGQRQIERLRVGHECLHKVGMLQASGQREIERQPLFHGVTGSGNDLERRRVQQPRHGRFIESEPQVPVVQTHPFLSMPIKIRHHEQPAGTQHAPDFGKGILRVGQVVQHHIDAGEIRLAVPQRKVAEFPDAQRDALGFPFHPGKPPPGSSSILGEPSTPMICRARPRIRSSTIPVPHPRSTEVSQPSGIVSHTAPARSNPPSTSRLRVSQCSAMVLKNCRVLSARSSMILAAISTSARISASSSRKGMAAFRKAAPSPSFTEE